MTRSMNPVLALLALLVLSGCSSEKSESSASPASGSSGTGSLVMGGAGGQSGSGLAGGSTGTGTAGMSASGTSASGVGAAGASAAGASAAGTGAPGAGSSGNGTGGDSTSGAGGTSGSAGGTPPALGDCVGDWKAGTYPADFITGGGASTLPPIGGRNYAVHVPTGYDCRLPTPLLFCLHGLGQSGYSFCVQGSSSPTRTGGMVAKADEAGFIVVMSTGLGPSAADVQVIRDIVENLDTHLNIDHKRVYATGHSFGGYLSLLLACTAADLFTAVAPNAGSLSAASCSPAKPIAVLASHGDADGIVPFGSLARAVASLAEANGCSMMATPRHEALFALVVARG
jgi:predicted esterase